MKERKRKEKILNLKNFKKNQITINKNQTIQKPLNTN